MGGRFILGANFTAGATVYSRRPPSPARAEAAGLPRPQAGWKPATSGQAEDRPGGDCRQQLPIGA